MTPEAPARIVFLGSGDFAVPILEALLAAPWAAVVGVVSGPDRPAGRGRSSRPTAVAARAGSEGLRLLRPERLREPSVVSAIGDLRPDVGVLADYGRLVPPEILAIPPRGILNVHPSILPRHRGATPIPATILAGDREAGVSVMAMDAGLDTGPIVAIERWPLDGAETAPDLEAEAARRGAALVTRVLPDWLAGRLTATPQPVDGVTLTRLARRDDGRLDPTRSAAELERAVRAWLPWPGSFVDLPDGRLVVLEAAVVPSEPGDRPGTLVTDGDGLALATIDGRLRLRRVRPAGGREMTSGEYRRGRGRDVAGRVLA